MDDAGEVAFVKHSTVFGKWQENLYIPSRQWAFLFFFFPYPFSWKVVRYEHTVFFLYHFLGFYLCRVLCLWGTHLDSWASFYHSTSWTWGFFFLVNVATARDWGHFWLNLA